MITTHIIAKIYYTDRTIQIIDTGWTKKPNYEQLTQLTKQHFPWFERVKIRHPEFGVTDMLVDEEGLLKGLPLNRIASSYYAGGSPIVGTAIVFSRGVI